MVFCFVGGPDGTPAVERRVDNLDAAVAEVEALLAAQAPSLGRPDAN
jgi:hypothetical protein